ncbi:MAG TPA: GNAT family protein [Archangium sp.]|uniref:GNAT family N-acetyltransferase n=1 Tax=Archangium sp. TaxID=1872627 RepID=UPI002E3425C8|nr:GNAT family protein [Archangium sp.]HEX5747782.1 GNAT family protein [Archangium sp.]
MSATSPAYSIRTPRLLLRCCEPSDAAPRLEAVTSSGAHLHEFFPPQPEGPPPLALHVAQLRKMRGGFDLDQDRPYVVVELHTGRFLGEVGLLTRAGLGAREVGYWLRRDAIGQGLATEMTAAVIRTAFELDKVSRVDLTCDPANAASAAVARRLGFTLEGRLRERQLAPHHVRGDILCFSLLASEYPHGPAHAVPIEAFDYLGQRIL